MRKIKLRMRLGRTAWLVLGLGAFVIVLATMLVIYSSQSDEQGGVERSLAEAQTQLATLLSRKAAVEAQLSEQQNGLAEAQALLDSARGSFPRVGTSIEYDEVLSVLASLHDLEVTSMTAEAPREKKIGGITFVTVAFDAEVKGEVNSILSMVHDIATDVRFVSATVEVVNIIVPEPESVVTAGEEPEKPSAKIELVGYSYGGE
jgi:hypothetical protein